MNYRSLLETDKAVYVKGHASVSEESGKLIAEKLVLMDKVEKEIWIQVENLEGFREKQESLYDIIRQFPGEEKIVIYLKQERALKRLPSYQNIFGSLTALNKLKTLFGEKNIGVKEKSIEK